MPSPLLDGVVEDGRLPTDRLFEGIPEGIWWVAWVDHLTFATSMQTVHVVLVPLSPELLPRVADGGAGPGPRASLGTLLVDRRSCRVVRVDVSVLPLFAVGDVFVRRRLLASAADASRVASVCDLPEVGATMTIDVDARPYGFREDGSRHRRARGAPIGDMGRSPSLDLLVSRYPLTAGTSRVLPLRTATGRAFLPAAELIRSMVAPRPRMIRLLLGEGLATALPKMVESSGPGSPGEPFPIALRHGFAADDAPYVANMIEAYNPVGAEGAGRAHASRQARMRPTRPSGRLAAFVDIADGADPLAVCFPFGSGDLRIEALCLSLPGGDALACKVVGGRWPSSPPLAVTIERDVVDPSREPVKRPRGPAGARDERGDEGRDAPVVPDERPGHGGDAVEVEAEPLRWRGLPEMTVSVRRGRRAPTRAVAGDAQSGGGVSVSEPETGGRHRRGDADRSAPSVPERFLNTIAMLDRLMRTGRLVAHEDVVPRVPGLATEAMLPRPMGDHLLWSFADDDPRRWTSDRKRGQPRRPRLFLIRRLTLPGGRVAYWVTLEKVTNNHAAVLLTFGEPAPVRGVPPSAEAGAGDLWAALGLLADHRGRVPRPDDFARLVRGGRTSASTFRHVFKPKAGEGHEPLVHDLDEEAADRALRRLVGGRPTSTPD